MKKQDLSELFDLALKFDPTALEQMRVDTYNQSTGSLEGYDCPKCLNKGTFAFLRDGRICTVDCECMVPRRCIIEMERSGLKHSVERLTFDQYNATEPWQIYMKEKVMDYANDPKDWLLLCGAPGSGKTHLCTAVCREFLLSGHEVRYMTWREKASAVLAANFESEKRDALLHHLKTAEILYIDDLFKVPNGTTPSKSEINLAFELINYRYSAKLRTIVSTEKSPAELLEIDEGTFSRLFQMAKENLITVQKGAGKNYRLPGNSFI